MLESSYLIDGDSWREALTEPLSNYFTTSELEECRLKGVKEQQALRGRWAAKQALGQLLSRYGIDFQYRQLQTVSTKTGLVWQLSNNIKEIDGKKALYFLSISHEEERSIAFVIIDLQEEVK